MADSKLVTQIKSTAPGSGTQWDPMEAAVEVIADAIASGPTAAGLTDAQLRAAPVPVSLGTDADVIGKVGIDQTTPGTTNAVSVQSAKGATNLAMSQVTATGTAATLAAARATRRSVLFTNTHASASCWIGPATVTAANGQKLGPGQACPFSWVGLFQIIDDGVTHPVVCVADEYD